MEKTIQKRFCPECNRQFFEVQTDGGDDYGATLCPTCLAVGVKVGEPEVVSDR